MSQNNHPAIKHKLGLLELAEQLNNVSRACKVMGVSRDTFYRVKNAHEDGGIEALLAKSKKISNPKNRVEPHVEDAVLKLAIDNPALGQARVSNELRKVGVFVSGGGVRSIWLRHMSTVERLSSMIVNSIWRPVTLSTQRPKPDIHRPMVSVSASIKRF